MVIWISNNFDFSVKKNYKYYIPTAFEDNCRNQTRSEFGVFFYRYITAKLPRHPYFHLLNGLINNPPSHPYEAIVNMVADVNNRSNVLEMLLDQKYFRMQDDFIPSFFYVLY